VDAVYDDVGLRFQKVEQIGEALLFESQRKIADAVSPAGQDSVVVFNYENGPRTDFVTVRLPVQDGKWPAKLIAPDGAEAPLQVIERGGHSPTDRRERVTFGFVARDVPGFGYRAYGVEYGEAEEAGGRRSAAEDATRQKINSDTGGGMFTVAANDGGTLYFEDWGSTSIYPPLNQFVDGGDRGDEYTYCPPDQDHLVDTPAKPPEIGVIENGPARRTMEIRMVYRLPEGLTENRRSRSDELVDCAIVTRGSVYDGVPRVDIETQIDNRAKDHRLRVLIPTLTSTTTSHAEQHFGVVERPVAVPEDDGTWVETPVGTYPAKTFVDLSDGDRGLMLATRGLPEYEAIEEEDGTITLALTLLRCVGALSLPNLKTRKGHAGPHFLAPGAQMQGRWKFQYSLIPHEGGWDAPQDDGPPPFVQAHNFARPMRAIRTSRGRGELPPEGSFLEIEPAAVILSALKVAEDDASTIVRVYNISNETVEARIRPRWAFRKVERVDLNEENAVPAEATDAAVRLGLKANEIVTLRFAANSRGLKR
jgi:hypothetical protein